MSPPPKLAADRGHRVTAPEGISKVDRATRRRPFVSVAGLKRRGRIGAQEAPLLSPPSPLLFSCPHFYLSFWSLVLAFQINVPSCPSSSILNCPTVIPTWPFHAFFLTLPLLPLPCLSSPLIMYVYSNNDSYPPPIMEKQLPKYHH